MCDGGAVDPRRRGAYNSGMAVPIEPFQLLIKPVGPRCNLACRYCFYSHGLEPDRSLPGRMPDDVLETMVRKYLALRLPVSVFCWQGGEPTLAGLDFFRRVVELQKRHGGDGQVVSNALQTNGQVIDASWASFLAEYRFLVGLSIDGPSAIHDAERVDARGGGSLANALRAAALFDEHRVEYNILTVVHRGNQERAAEIFRWQLSQGWRHLQYIPCVERGDDGRATDFSVTPDGYGRFLCDLWQAYRESGRRDIGIRTFDHWLSRKVLGQGTLCTLDERCGRYLLVKPDGGLFPCDFFFEPQWRLGNVMSDDLADVHERVRRERFGGLKGACSQECRQCRHLALCYGGCPKDRQTPFAGGDEDRRRSYLCEGYRLFLDRHGAELDGLAEAIRRERQAMAERQARAARQVRAAAAGGGAVGRNDPCPCGSGLKYKRCCGK